MSLSEQLEPLLMMSAAQLTVEWRRVMKGPPPAFSPDLMARAISYELQARRLGSLSKAAERELRRLAQRLANGEGFAPPTELRIKPGTSLIRDWGGQTHHVTVLEAGYLYADREYRSLSQIAGVITGTRWSGPRFFGLKGRGQTTGTLA